MPLDLTADERAQLAADVAEELDTGRYGDRFVLSRRQLLSIAGGSAGVAGLTALGVDPAAAQSAAGQVGTSSEPVDVFGFDLDVQGALQRDLDAGGQAISNVGSLSTDVLDITNTSFAATITADQSISSNTGTKVEIDSIVSSVDDFGGFDSTNNQYVVQSSGKYLILGKVGYRGSSVTAGDARQVSVSVNDSTTVRPISTTAGRFDRIEALDIRELSSGDEVELFATNFDSDDVVDSQDNRTVLALTKVA